MSTTNFALLALHRSLVSIDCITENEHPCSVFLAEHLRALGWTVETQLVSPAEGSRPARENVFAYPGKNRNVRAVLNSHIDVVPPYIPYREDDENVYGRGSADAKGSVAAQIVAADELWRDGRLGEGDLGVLYVVGEEADHVGMVEANNLGITPEFLIVGEPTELILAKGHKGIIKFRVEVTGKAGEFWRPLRLPGARHFRDRCPNRGPLHAETPSKYGSQLHLSIPGISPTHFTHLQALPVDARLGETTMNIGLLSGGVAANVIPALASADIMCRVTTTVDDLWRLILEAVGDRPGVRLVRQTTFEPVRCEVVEGFETDVMKYNTDIGAWKSPVKSYLYGPGSILCAHAPHEFISKKELLQSVDGYKRLITTLLQK
ncbi:hypothetical protein BC936DRAFT_149271 [Jimgerdemannia flammicorona]|uniref:Peptidase M20 dimerisation domain-containing protein n=1 Tax=Jimgerdemannia flammicorona TaxID=994334 RepID=A0A433DK52_9FUNG|nr:hypothetical protein BC936DRAFT_149271 [Jimgerdemannia flammicorona]